MGDQRRLLEQSSDSSALAQTYPRPPLPQLLRAPKLEAIAFEGAAPMPLLWQTGRRP